MAWEKVKPALAASWANAKAHFKGEAFLIFCSGAAGWLMKPFGDIGAWANVGLATLIGFVAVFTWHLTAPALRAAWSSNTFKVASAAVALVVTALGFLLIGRWSATVNPEQRWRESTARLLAMSAELERSGTAIFEHIPASDAEFHKWIVEQAHWTARALYAVDRAHSEGIVSDLQRFNFRRGGVKTSDLHAYNPEHLEMRAEVRTRLAGLNVISLEAASGHYAIEQTPRSKIADTIEMFTQQIKDGHYLLSDKPLTEDDFARWQVGLESWESFTRSVIQARTSELDAQRFGNVRADGRPWAGFSIEHSRMRAVLFSRIEVLQLIAKEQESMLERLEDR